MAGRTKPLRTLANSQGFCPARAGAVTGVHSRAEEEPMGQQA